MNITEHPFPHFFPTAKMERLIASATRQTLPEGEILFSEKDPSDALYLVLEGEVALIKEIEGASAVELAVLGPGDYLGELGLLDGNTRSATARVRTTLHLARIDRAAFDEALSGAPTETFRAIVSQISANLRNTNNRWMAETVRKEKLTLVGEMANTIVHDLRSPFTVIDLACQTIKMRNTDTNTNSYCNAIETQVARMTAMVNDILEFSKGTSKLRCRPTTVTHLFETFSSYYRQELERKSLTLETSPVEATVYCDEDKLLRVIQNLVNNAADAMGGKPGRIVLTAARVDERVELAVKDDGPGIPEKIQATLFEPFVTMAKPGGTGLGLAIARSVVEAHDGEITFETEQDVGTTFRISLPACQPA